MVDWPSNPIDGQVHEEGGQSWTFRSPPNVWRIAEASPAIADYDSGWLDAWALPYSHSHGMGATPLRYEFILKFKAGNPGGFNEGEIAAGLQHQDGDGARRKGSYATDTLIVKNGGFTMSNRADTTITTVTDAHAQLRILCWADVPI